MIGFAELPRDLPATRPEKSLRRAALADLQTMVRGIGDPAAGVCLGGSAAEAGAFRPGSDLDLMVVAESEGRATEVARLLRDQWAADHRAGPTVDVKTCPLTAGPEPYLRGALWISGPERLRMAVADSLTDRAAARAHALEAFCEDRAARIEWARRPHFRPRTHPDGLRAVWCLRYLSAAVPIRGETSPWLDELLREAELPSDKIEAAVRTIRRAIRPASPTPEIDLGEGMRALRDALERSIAHRAGSLGIDTAGLDQLRQCPRSDRLAAVRDGGDAAIHLSWCDTDPEVLAGALFANPADPGVAMGIAFNRAAPSHLVTVLPGLPVWLTSRGLLRRRWEAHPAMEDLRGFVWEDEVLEKTSEVLFGKTYKVLEKTSEVLFGKTYKVLETSEVSLETSEVSLETSEVSLETSEVSLETSEVSLETSEVLTH